MASASPAVDLEDLLEVVKDPDYREYASQSLLSSFQVIHGYVVALLEKFAKNHGDSPHRGRFQLSKYSDYETITRTFKLVPVGEDGHVLVWQGPDKEEAVLYVQGFIAEHALPPVTRGTR